MSGDLAEGKEPQSSENRAGFPFETVVEAKLPYLRDARDPLMMCLFTSVL